MRKGFWLSLGAVVWVNSLVSQAALGAAPDPLFATGLDWKPGPVCTYDTVHNGKKARWNFSVSESAGGTIKGSWSREGSGAAVSVPVVKTENGLKFIEDMSMVHGTPMSAEPGYQWLAFPLEPRKAWEGRSVVSGTDAGGKPWKVDVRYASKVSDWEKVKTGVGEALALKIISDEKIAGLSANFSGTAQMTTWIGPGICSLKKLEYKNTFKETASAVLAGESGQ
jgi:hypothetical protein